ncbi:hypothetical protein NDU88_007593 [Pleurodeles waltl]|uniref:Uncharacterized protein n=1 Tax=Pleurodeles waltl TaxID=8319 RepID=A0AAV7NWF3_PLEWA|nr:hypothetical protein NDU88_007593 [Pleurodeles waltl]
MKDGQMVELQDDLEKMIAHMWAEALKRGKDWLRAKMEDSGVENQEKDLTAPVVLDLTEETGTGGNTTPPPQRPSKRQRTEAKPTKRASKKPRSGDQTADELLTVAPAPSTPRMPAEGEHISTLIKECFKSFAPLPLRGNGAGLGMDGQGPTGGQPGNQLVSKEQSSTGDPLTAWDTQGKVPDMPVNIGNPRVLF